jgi:hypothetical protein
LAYAVSHILPEKIDPGAGAVLAHCLLYLLDAAEFCQRATPGLGPRHASRDLLVGQHVGVRANLLVEVTLDLPLPEEVQKAALKARSKSHFYSRSC